MVTPDGQSERELTTYDDWRAASPTAADCRWPASRTTSCAALFDRQLELHRAFMESRG